MQEAERLIEEFLRSLRDAETLIDTDGQDALRKAQEAQDRAGQQNDRLTQIAKEATALADQYVRPHAPPARALVWVSAAQLTQQVMRSDLY